MTLEEFKINVGKRRNQPRKHKPLKVYGLKDYYKYYKEKCENTNKNILPYKIFANIIWDTNDFLKNRIGNNGLSIMFPCDIGSLSLAKHEIKKCIVDGKLVTDAKVDWNKTLELWFEDKEAMNNKTLVRINRKDRCYVAYNKEDAKFINKRYFLFQCNRQLKELVAKNYKDGKIDAINY